MSNFKNAPYIFESPKQYQKIKCSIEENSKEKLLEAKYNIYANSNDEKNISYFCLTPDIYSKNNDKSNNKSSNTMFKEEGSTDAKTNSEFLSNKKKDMGNESSTKVSTFDVDTDSMEKSNNKQEIQDFKYTQAAIKSVIFQ